VPGARIERITVRTVLLSDMSDDESEEDAEPAVELGTGTTVEGAPLARVASRLTWPQERSRIVEKEGDATIRTPAGPQDLEPVLEETDISYFDSQQEFTDAVKDVVGRGPVPTE
jgi:hypothetical protein